MNKEKKYIAHCYELDTNKRYSFYWSMRQFELAEQLVKMGAMTLIQNKGYFYWFNNVKKALKELKI